MGYIFEGKEQRSRRLLAEDLEKELKVFRSELGLDAADPCDLHRHKNLLEQYVTVNHGNIAWYIDARDNERRRTRNFRWFSICLLAAIPLAIFFAPAVAEELSLGLSTASIEAQISVGLAAFLGVHRSIAAWLQNRKIATIFWKAGADLKENLYTLEDKWHGKALIDDPANKTKRLDPVFAADLLAGTKQARDIVRTERQAYFETPDAPVVDLNAMLTSAGSQASALVKAFQAPTQKERLADVAAEAARRDTIAKALAKVKMHEAEAEGYRQRIAELTTQAEAAGDPEKARIEKEVVRLEKLLNTANENLIKSRAEIEALR